MTDAQARAAGGEMLATRGTPTGNLVRRQGRCDRCHLGPTGKQRILDGAVIWSEHPVGATLPNRKAEMLEALHGASRRVRTSRSHNAHFPRHVFVFAGCALCVVGTGYSGLKAVSIQIS